MTAVVLEIAPLALAIALSPFGPILGILLLFTPRPRATAGAFLAGWVVGIGVATGIFVALASIIEVREETPTWASWVRIGLGAVLLLLAVRLWVTRREKAEPAWMRAVGSATPGRALRLGLLLSAANPKALLLSVGGGLAIGAADLTTSGAVVGVAVFTAIASATVALPLILHVLAGERILVPLGRVVDWLTANNAAVVAVVFATIGVLLLVEGIGGV